MKKLVFILLLFAVSFASCDRMQNDTQDEVLARVGDKVLTVSDVRALFNDGNVADSIGLMQYYVDTWVKKQLKVQQAEQIFESTNADIEAKVEEYRNSLLIRKLEQYYLDKLDTLYTEQEIETYYNQNKNNFTLDRTIVKGRILKIGDNSRRKKEFKAMMTSGGREHDELVSLAEKNKAELTEFESWVDFSQFLTILPVAKIKNPMDLLDKREVHEIKDRGEVYMVYVTEFRKEGDVSPLEMVEDIVKRVIYNQRKQDLLRKYEDSLYHQAVYDRILEVKQIDNNIE